MPEPVWRYIVAKVRCEYPDTIFFLEGLGGPLQTVEACMRNVAEQLAGTHIRIAMGTATKPEERDEYLEMGVTLFQEEAPA